VQNAKSLYNSQGFHNLKLIKFSNEKGMELFSMPFVIYNFLIQQSAIIE